MDCGCVYHEMHKRADSNYPDSLTSIQRTAFRLHGPKRCLLNFLSTKVYLVLGCAFGDTYSIVYNTTDYRTTLLPLPQ